nr:hypothetical protein [uncultured Desulfobacter sp.]
MDINNIQRMNAYTANAQMTNTASVLNNNKEATAAVTDGESTQTLQEAFQVEITPEALTLQSQRKQDTAQKEQEMNPQLTPQSFKTQQMDQLQTKQGSQLNIVA